MKRTVAFYWLIGIAIAALTIALGFYFDDTVRDFMAEHQTPALRSFMRYVSLFGDWPLHVAFGLLLLAIAWIRDSKKWARIFLAMLIAMSLAGVTATLSNGRFRVRARRSIRTCDGAARVSAPSIIHSRPATLTLQPLFFVPCFWQTDGSAWPAFPFRS